MPNEKHFHGQSHMGGGFDIDESTLHPDANYWQSAARGAWKRLEKLTDVETAAQLVKRFWNDNYTWKDICLHTEAIIEEMENAKNVK